MKAAGHSQRITSKERIRRTINALHTIVPREQWGMITPLYSALEHDWDYNAIVLHHSGNLGRKTATAIEAYQMNSKQYDDIAYHYLLAQNGRIFEGRSILHKGAHVRNKNTGKIGILLMGDYDEQWWDNDDTLSGTQMRAANALIVTLKKQFPTMKQLGGHKEFVPGYSCPGNLIMNEMSRLRHKHGLAKP